MVCIHSQIASKYLQLDVDMYVKVVIAVCTSDNTSLLLASVLLPVKSYLTMKTLNKVETQLVASPEFYKISGETLFADVEVRHISPSYSSSPTRIQCVLFIMVRKNIF